MKVGCIFSETCCITFIENVIAKLGVYSDMQNGIFNGRC